MSFPPADPAAPDGRPAPLTRGFVLGPDDGDAYWWLGSLTLTKVGGDATGGALDIVDHRVPAGYAPPAHVHTVSDEIFFILAGEFAVRCGDDHWRAGPGSLVFLPRLVPHGFTVSGDGPGRTLLLNTPAGFGEVITELGQATTDLTLPGPDVADPAPERIGEVSGRFGIHPA
jgi:mannose-6-phosphate isomerase-like protein (cupin superfamily)